MKDAAILADKREFIGRWLHIENKARKGTVIPFNRPTGQQRQALTALTDPAVKLVVFLKSRQVYMSTVVAGASFHDHAAATGPLRTLVACNDGDTTDSLLRKHQVFSENLPGRIGEQLGIRVNRNKHEIHFPRGGGMLKLATVGGRSLGKSQTYHHLVAEEMAFWPNEDEAWASITSAVSDEGRKVIVSTPNGPGGRYEQQVEEAYKQDKIHGNPTVKFFFWPWFEHAEYRREAPDDWEPSQEEVDYAETWGLSREQSYWRHWKIHGPDGIGLAKFRKFYPTTMEEGFLTFEGGWFDVGYLNELIGIHKDNRQQGQLRIYRRPEPGLSYAIGVDPSWCNGGHYAAAVVLDEKGRMVAVLSCRDGGTRRFAQRVSRLAGIYNGARILCESNKGGGGSVVLEVLRAEGCSLWHDRDTGKDWNTNHGSKAEAYEHARQMVNGYALELCDLQVLRELTRIREEDGYIGNPRKGQGEKDDTKDDHADALVLAEWNRRTLPRGGVLTPRRGRPKQRLADNPHAAIRSAA